MLDPSDIAALERAIVASVAPERTVEIEGWLVPLDAGDIGRARSAVPLSHDADPAALPDVEALYAQAGLPPAFRVAETDGLSPVVQALRDRGYQPHTPTIMKLGASEGLRSLSEVRAEPFDTPDEAWIACFCGEGFDPATSALRIANYRRVTDPLFAAVREGSRTVAVGLGTFNDGWTGIHAMRTAPDRRGEGLAARVLAAIGQAALERGVSRAVLQVKEDNPARSLYRKAGFEYAWRYRYWARN